MNSIFKIFSRLSAIVHKVAFASVVGLLVASCADNNFDIDSPDNLGGYITLQLSSTKASSRASDDTEFDINNENRLVDVWVFLFPLGATDDAHPVLMQNVSVNTSHEPAGSNVSTVSIRFTRDKIQDIFPENNKAIAYVIANLPETTTAPDDPTWGDDGPTWGELKALTITADFASDVRPLSFVMDGDGEITKEDASDVSQTKVTGDIHLKRAASKISLNVKVAESVVDAYGETWTSRTDNMIVLITNGVKNSCVQPAKHQVAAEDYYNTELGNASAPARGFKDKDETKTFPFAIETPFYTFPNSWTENSELMTYLTLIVQWQNEGAFRTCYYMVPVVSGQSYLSRNVSYRVNIDVNILGSTKPEEPLELDDVSYRAVDWGTEAFDVQIDDFRYLVVDQNTYTINNEGEISIPFYSSHETVIKYDLDTLNYYLFNTTNAGLERTMAINNAVRRESTTTNAAIPSYADDPNYKEEFGTDKYIYSDWIDNTPDPATNTRTLRFSHQLYQWTAQKSVAGGYSNLDSGFGPYTSEANATAQFNLISKYVLNNTNTPAFSRYRMTITIVHKDKIGKTDEAQYTEKFVIWQYPAMSIETQQNFYGGTSRDQRTAVRGNMWVNGSQNQANTNNWYVTYGLGGNADNANPNQYIISVTQLTDNSYIIGDPRVSAINNLTENNTFNGTAPGDGWATAPGIENNNTDNPTTTRKLSFYYPTDQSNDNLYRVAPKFRIASSYGVAYDMSYLDAQRRCASYQELEYPAGRWRIPTVGEIEYIMNLSSQGMIPALFTMSSGNNHNYYWSAQGRIEARLTNGKLSSPTMSADQKASVRCVYDEWYWEGSTIKTTKEQSYGNGNNRVVFPQYPFVWGDAQRK